jgi:hypothetical protein
MKTDRSFINDGQKEKKEKRNERIIFVYLGANTKTKADPPSSTIQFYW